MSVKQPTKISALSLIVVMTFVGLYSSFNILPLDGDYYGDRRGQWYNLFIPYEYEQKSYSKEGTMDYMIDRMVEGSTNVEINRNLDKLRPKVLVITFIVFLLSLFVSYRYYYKNANVGVLWLLLILSVCGIFFL